MSVGDPNATESGRKLPPDFHTAMAHFYRGEMNRLTVWHVRLDTTTNWAIVLTTGMTTFTLGSEKTPHYVLLLGLSDASIVMTLVLVSSLLSARTSSKAKLSKISTSSGSVTFRVDWWLGNSSSWFRWAASLISTGRQAVVVFDDFAVGRACGGARPLSGQPFSGGAPGSGHPARGRLRRQFRVRAGLAA